MCETSGVEGETSKNTGTKPKMNGNEKKKWDRLELMGLVCVLGTVKDSDIGLLSHCRPATAIAVRGQTNLTLSLANRQAVNRVSMASQGEERRAVL